MRRNWFGLAVLALVAAVAPVVVAGAEPSPDALPRLGGAVVVDDASGHVFVTQRRSVAVHDLTGRRVTVTVPGGPLEIEWGSDDHVRMTGPAEFEHSGVFRLGPATAGPV